jgi:tetratricopeptide (TPR) repeat protein
MSPVARRWGEIQHVLKVLEAEDCKETDILPDYIPSAKESAHTGRFGCSVLRRNCPWPRIGNDLHNLPDILRQNLYSCLKSMFEGDDSPVESDVEDLKRRISVIRLRHQADRNGFLFNPSMPWAFQIVQQPTKNKLSSGDSAIKGVHPADLVPDNPSDWIPYDPEICECPWDFGESFNRNEYGDFYRQRYLNKNDIGIDHDKTPSRELPWLVKKEAKNTVSDAGLKEDDLLTGSGDTFLSNSENYDSSANYLRDSSKVVSSSEDEEDAKQKRDNAVNQLLYETIVLLKNGGNAALQAGEFHVAARRYDKAIQYSAVACMSFPVHDLEFAQGRHLKLRENGGFHLDWTPLLKVLVVTRLNMALLMLKPECSHPDQAAEQAHLALHDLKPFCALKGKVMKGSTLDTVHRADEPEETFDDAAALEAKGYFRLGSAQYELGEYAEAIRSFEASVTITEKVNGKTDNLVLRRLLDAKRQNQRKNKRHRKKFKLAFDVIKQANKKSSDGDQSEDN